ncbi:MAG: hypothetical protein HC927_12400, partial [Deltaproteobacteria bacterium]|nr:hypothetical protein [Deltaproteobacteria bacterium]
TETAETETAETETADTDTTETADTDTTETADTDTTETTDTDADDDTIYAIQDGTIAEDTPVTVAGVWVTAVRANGFYAQEIEGGQFSGVWVFVGNMGPDISGLAIGDLVDIGGVTTEFAGLTEIDASAGTVTEVGTIDPVAPDLVTTAELAADVGEPWESVFVRIEGEPLTVTQLPGFDEFIVTNADGDAFVDNYLYNLILDGGMDFPSFGLGATFTAIQGPVNFSFDNFKVAPRVAADLEGYMAPVNPLLGVET